MVAAIAQRDDPNVVDDRVEQFVDLGFSVDEAKVLAVARKSDGNYWRSNEVQRMLDQRATHQQLVRIMQPLPVKYDPEVGLPDKEYALVV